MFRQRELQIRKRQNAVSLQRVDPLGADRFQLQEPTKEERSSGQGE